MSLTISYKGVDIVDETADCNKTLKTEGKYCEADIGVGYTSEAPTLISKSITANGEYDAEDDGADGYSSVSVDVGGTPTQHKPIVFVELDGSVIYEYDYAEVAAMESLPEIPTVEGFVNEGWWRDLATMKAATKPTINYPHRVPTDGKTRVTVEVVETRRNPRLIFWLTGGASVDWGDGTTPDAYNYNSRTAVKCDHTYASAGTYEIVITPDAGAVFDYNSVPTGYPNHGYFYIYQSVNTNNVDGMAYENQVTRLVFGSGWRDVNGRIMFGYYYDRMQMGNIPQSVGAVLYERGYVVTYAGTLVSIGNQEDMYGRVKWLDLDGVTSIGHSAFYGCTSLTSVTLPSGLTSIGSAAFYGCASLTSVTLPDGLTSIGNQAFYGCTGLTSVTLPDGLTSIGSSAFYGCAGLTSVTLPDGLTEIQNNAFAACYSLNFDCTALTVTGGEVDCTLGGTSAFVRVPEMTLLFADQATMAVYAAATNWAYFAANMTYVGA